MKPRQLIILGTGVHGAEMAEIVDRVNAVEPTWELLGYVRPSGEAPAHPGGVLNANPILGAVDVLSDHPDACLVPDNGFPADAKLPAERLVSLIDPSAFVSRTAQLGRGCVVYPGCYVGLNAKLGDRVFMLSGCTVNHDDVIEDRVVMASRATLAGVVHVEEDCYLGQACAVRQHLRIGRGSLIGMGAVVVKDVEPDSVMVGNPARPMRKKQ